MGAVVFQWVRGHGGVHCNAYADMIAKACLDEEVGDDVGEQRATTVRYEVRSEMDGGWAGVPADVCLLSKCWGGLEGAATRPQTC